MIGALQLSSGRPVATFTIDGEGNTTYSAPTYSSSEHAVYNVTLYSRRDLEQGRHELKVTNMNGTDPNVLWLDYFLIDTSPVSVSTTSAGSSSQSSPSPSSASVSATSGSTFPEATSSTSQSAKRGNTAAIVGGVVGSVAVLVLLGALLFLRRRRRKQKSDEGMATTEALPWG